jgi:hypothetical protein
MEKFDLIRDHCLVGRPVVDVEMADAWIDAELTFRAWRAASIAGPGLAARRPQAKRMT